MVILALPGLVCRGSLGTNTLASDIEANFYIIETRAHCYKTFNVRNSRMFVISWSVAPCSTFQPSLMFVCKARRLPYSGIPNG
jgi:hypothetical protein